MEHKSFGVAELKAMQEGDAPGTFEAIVSVFGNVDEGGDRVKKGAFKRTLEERGLPPIVWSHDWQTPPIGTVDEAAESNEGLRIKGRLFVDEGDDSPMARAVYTAMKAKDGNGLSPLREFSFGYSVRSSSEETKNEETVRVIEDVDLFEIGPTLVGMNPKTRLIGIKSAESALAAEVEKASTDVVEEVQEDDNAVPNDSELSEEERRRIAQLVAARPHHIDQEDTDG